MTNFFKFVAFLAPVAALVLYLAVMHSVEVSKRMDVQNKEFVQAQKCFDKDWAHFFDKKYWAKRGECPYGKCEQGEKTIKELEAKQYAVAGGLEKAMEDVGNEKESDNNTIQKHVKAYGIPK